MMLGLYSNDGKDDDAVSMVYELWVGVADAGVGLKQGTSVVVRAVFAGSSIGTVRVSLLLGMFLRMGMSGER